MELESHEHQDRDLQPATEAHQPQRRAFQLIQNEQRRKEKVTDAHAQMRRIADRLRQQTGAETAITIVHVQPHADTVEASDFYSTPHLQQMHEEMQTFALYCCSMSIMAQQRQKRYEALTVTHFEDILKEHQIKLLKWVLKQLVHAQKRTAPFDRTTAEEMHRQYSWYPISVQWTRLKNMSPSDLQTLFKACMAAIGSGAAELIDDFQSLLPLKLPAHTQMKCVAALRCEAQIPAPPVPDQICPGKDYSLMCWSMGM